MPPLIASASAFARKVTVGGEGRTTSGAEMPLGASTPNAPFTSRSWFLTESSYVMDQPAFVRPVSVCFRK